MARSVLRRDEALVWLPGRTQGERGTSALDSEARLLVIAQEMGELRASRRSLETLGALRRVRLVFDPRDVTLLPLHTPRLSAARLRKALPGLVEESLLQDPAACVLAASLPQAGGTGRVAVVDRAWFDRIVAAFEARGLRVTGAWAAPLSLPEFAGAWSLAVTGTSIALRMDGLRGLGWSRPQDASDQRSQEAAFVDLFTAAAADPNPSPATAGPSGLPERIVAYLESETTDSQSAVSGTGLTRTALTRAAAHLGLALEVKPITELAKAVPALDLMPARARLARPLRWQFDASEWRVPGLWALAVVAVLVLGLNLHRASLESERAAIRASLEADFRRVLPGDRVIVDPLLQVSRHVSTLRVQSGQAGSDDFLPLLARFAQALGTRATDAVTQLEYRDAALRVHFQPAWVEGRAAREQLVSRFAGAGLTLRFDNDRDPVARVTVRT